MSKVLAASCVGGVVTTDGVPVAATKLSEGVAGSLGILLLDEDEATYVAKTSPDLKTTLEMIAEALGEIASALSAIDGAGHLIAATAGVPGPPVATGSIGAINSLKAQLETLKDNLR